MNFNQMTLSEKLLVKEGGPPQPSLTRTQAATSNKKAYSRSFNIEWYKKVPWLCGCDELNALFCFPCILFGGHDVWTKTGYINLAKLKEKTTEHGNSARHITNSISLQMLGTTNIATSLSSAFAKSIQAHNNEVTANRQILTQIMDCIIYLAKHEQALRGSDESADSTNRGNYLDLLDYTAKLSPKLNEHLKSSTSFKGTSMTIQNEILDCFFDVYKQDILRDIEATEYVAIIADEPTDVSGKNQLAIILRYIVNCEVHERFWSFFNPEGVTADCLSSVILQELAIITKGNQLKVVAQTYDGAHVMSGAQRGVQTIVKAQYSNAHFTHCYAQ